MQFLSYRDVVKNFELYFLPLITVLFLIRSAIPLMIYPFMLLFVVYLILFSFSYYKKLNSIKNFIIDFKLYFVLLLIYIFAIIFTQHYSNQLIKEILGAIIVFLIAFFWHSFVQNKEDWLYMKTKFIKQYYILILFAGFAGLLIYLISLNGINVSFLNRANSNLTTSLVSDNNFYSLTLIYGIIITIYFLGKKKRKIIELGLQFCLYGLSLSILLSGSRRGVTIIALIYFILFVANIISIFYRKSNFLKNIVRNTRVVIIVFFTSFVIILVALFFTSPQFKNYLLEESKEDYRITQEKITASVYTYATIIYDKADYWKINDFLWGKVKLLNELENFYTFYPESYKNIDKKRVVFPVINTTDFNLPKIAGGILFNKNSEHSLWLNKRAKYIIATSKQKLPLCKIVQGQNEASVWCYVSDSCNIDIARFELAHKDKSHRKRVFYDFSKKGQWQELKISFNNEKDTLLEFNYFVGKRNIIDFKDVKGYVLFVNPLIEGMNKNTISNKEKSKRRNKLIKRRTSSVKFKLLNIRKNMILFFNKRIIKREIRNGDRFVENKDFINAARNYRYVLMIDSNNDSVKSKIEYCFSQPEFIKESVAGWDNMEKNFNSTSLFSENEDSLMSLEDKIKFMESDTLKKRSLKEDSELHVNKLYGQRTERWKYSYQLFFKEYSWKQMLIGDGFNYQYKFGERFTKNSQVDYPHNIIISAFLYSGLLGGFYYLFFLAYIIFWYWRNRRFEPILFAILILTLIFSMFSSNSHFDSTMIAIVCIFPFILKNNLIKNRKL